MEVNTQTLNLAPWVNTTLGRRHWVLVQSLCTSVGRGQQEDRQSFGGPGIWRVLKCESMVKKQTQSDKMSFNSTSHSYIYPCSVQSHRSKGLMKNNCQWSTGGEDCITVGESTLQGY